MARMTSPNDLRFPRGDTTLRLDGPPRLGVRVSDWLKRGAFAAVQPSCQYGCKTVLFGRLETRRQVKELEQI
ncbi:hypothetical protein PGIGA_G00225430 [Pangasianodon gigas]|uniref:Uncharacterized protein n=1 Tax=Pangasianodon gigas TaxID=30993 RepID=A0ACC5WK58_PANGG|nr:hypothetical protein [Pangasianodon gigas]